MYPVEGCKLDSLAGLTRSPTVNQLCFVEAIDRLGQSVVVTVAATANRRFDPRFGQSLGVVNAHVPGPTIRVVNERVAVGLSFVERLLQGIQMIESATITLNAVQSANYE
jgi:hypothetical protein